MAYHPALLRAVKAFNSGRYFEAHECLEEALDDVEDDDAVWQMFIGLIQVAVGYHKCRFRYAGGAKLLGMGLAKLAALPAHCGGVRLDSLRRRVRRDVDNGPDIASDPPRIQLVPRRS